MTPALGIPLVAICLLSQGFFSGSEMALVSSNRAILRNKADEGSSGARLALHMLEQEEARLLGSCLIGTNVSLIAGTTMAGLVLVQLGYHDEILLTLLYLPLGLLLGEAVPKVVYRHYADPLAPRLAPVLRVLQMTIMWPALWVVSKWSKLLKRSLGSEPAAIRTREDIVQMLDDHPLQTIDADDRAFIRGLLAMSQVTVGESMTPLVDIIGVAETATVRDAISLVLSSGFSRIPVFRERVDNIVGVVEAPELLYAPADEHEVCKVMTAVRFVPDIKRADELLREMRDSDERFAVVVDEYGGSVGIVTMEDLLEQLVGDIEDERDFQSPGIRKLGEREWRVPARTPIEDLEAAIDEQLPPGDYETVAGLLLAATGRIPAMGTTVRVGRMTFHIEAASERAILAVRLTIEP